MPVDTKQETQMNRRDFIRMGAVGGVAAAFQGRMTSIDAPQARNADPFGTLAPKPKAKDGESLLEQLAAPTPKAKPEFHVFSKMFQPPLCKDYDAIAELMAKAGFDGIEWTVRPKGHVLPENAKTDLPKAVKAARKQGLKSTMIVTGFTDGAAPESETLLKVAADCGVKQYRPGYFFYDVNAKLTHRFDENDKLSASFYMGDDEIYARYKTNTASTDSVKGQMHLNWDWGNLLAAVNWEHRFSSQIYSTTQLSYTRYRYDLQQSLQYDQTTQTSATTLGEKLDYNSYVNDLTLQTHFSYVPSTRHDLHWGGNYVFHRFRPQVTSFNLALNGNNMFAVDTLLTDGEVPAHEASLFVEDTYTPLSWLRLNLGLRGSLYAIQGKVYPSLEPRIGIRALMLQGFAFKAGYSYMSQYVHMLSNSSVSLPTDLWVPVTKQILPMRSMQVAAGINYDVSNQVELSVEGYYKRMINLIEYRDGASFIGTTQGWEEKVCMGDGWSYGVEFLAQRKTGKLTGWIGYTWSRSMRQFNREGQTINFGKPFHAKYDREHDLSITLQYAVTKNIDLSTTFVYGTGTRATLGTQTYYDPLSQRTITYIPERNNYRMPDYHRLDIGATFHYPIQRHPEWQSVWNVSIYNVYNNMNPFLLYQDSGKMYKISIFPLLPSVSYSFKF
jgi:hypothetical protein